MLRVVEDGRQRQRRRTQSGTLDSSRRTVEFGAHSRNYRTVM